MAMRKGAEEPLLGILTLTGCELIDAGGNDCEYRVSFPVRADTA